MPRRRRDVTIRDELVDELYKIQHWKAAVSHFAILFPGRLNV